MNKTNSSRGGPNGRDEFLKQLLNLDEPGYNCKNVPSSSNSSQDIQLNKNNANVEVSPAQKLASRCGNKHGRQMVAESCRNKQEQKSGSNREQSDANTSSNDSLTTQSFDSNSTADEFLRELLLEFQQYSSLDQHNSSPLLQHVDGQVLNTQTDTMEEEEEILLEKSLKGIFKKSVAKTMEPCVTATTLLDPPALFHGALEKGMVTMSILDGNYSMDDDEKDESSVTRLVRRFERDSISKVALLDPPTDHSVVTLDGLQEHQKPRYASRVLAVPTFTNAGFAVVPESEAASLQHDHTFSGIEAEAITLDLSSNTKNTTAKSDPPEVKTPSADRNEQRKRLASESSSGIVKPELDGNMYCQRHPIRQVPGNSYCNPYLRPHVGMITQSVDPAMYFYLHRPHPGAPCDGNCGSNGFPTTVMMDGNIIKNSTGIGGMPEMHLRWRDEQQSQFKDADVTGFLAPWYSGGNQERDAGARVPKESKPPEEVTGGSTDRGWCDVIPAHLPFSVAKEPAEENTAPTTATMATVSPLGKEEVKGNAKTKKTEVWFESQIEYLVTNPCAPEIQHKTTPPCKVKLVESKPLCGNSFSDRFLELKQMIGFAHSSHIEMEDKPPGLMETAEVVHAPEPINRNSNCGRTLPPPLSLAAEYVLATCKSSKTSIHSTPKVLASSVVYLSHKEDATSPSPSCDTICGYCNKQSPDSPTDATVASQFADPDHEFSKEQSGKKMYSYDYFSPEGKAADPFCELAANRARRLTHLGVDETGAFNIPTRGTATGMRGRSAAPMPGAGTSDRLGIL